MPRRAPLLLSFVLAGAFACQPSPQRIADGEDPISALAVAARSTRYDIAFWAREQHRKSPFWRDAVTFCRGKDVGLYPNCDAVRVVAFIENPRPFPVPAAPRPEAGSQEELR